MQMKLVTIAGTLINWKNFSHVTDGLYESELLVWFVGGDNIVVDQARHPEDYASLLTLRDTAPSISDFVRAWFGEDEDEKEEQEQGREG